MTLNTKVKLTKRDIEQRLGENPEARNLKVTDPETGKTVSGRKAHKVMAQDLSGPQYKQDLMRSLRQKYDLPERKVKMYLDTLTQENQIDPVEMKRDFNKITDRLGHLPEKHIEKIKQMQAEGKYTWSQIRKRIIPELRKYHAAMVWRGRFGQERSEAHRGGEAVKKALTHDTGTKVDHSKVAQARTYQTSAHAGSVRSDDFSSHPKATARTEEAEKLASGIGVKQKEKTPNTPPSSIGKQAPSGNKGIAPIGFNKF